MTESEIRISRTIIILLVTFSPSEKMGLNAILIRIIQVVGLLNSKLCLLLVTSTNHCQYGKSWVLGLSF